MAKNEKRIPIAEFEKVIANKCAETIPPVVVDEWNGITVTIRRSLPFAEVVSFVQEVVDACFTDGLFIPEVADVLIKRGVLSRYANFNLPIDIRKAYDMIYHSDAFEFVAARIDTNQLTEIVNAISTGIKYRADSDITIMRKNVNELLTIMEEMVGKLAPIFDGVGLEELRDLVSSLANQKLDEEKLVNAFLSFKREGSEADADIEHGGGPIKS